VQDEEHVAACERDRGVEPRFDERRVGERIATAELAGDLPAAAGLRRPRLLCDERLAEVVALPSGLVERRRIEVQRLLPQRGEARGDIAVAVEDFEVRKAREDPPVCD
jgi:hypothetical protein